MKSFTLAPLAILLLAPLAALHAAELHIAPAGNDTNPGTQQQPLHTIQATADRMKPGDTCVVHGGAYRETVHLRTSGQEGRPIRFTTAPNETAILEGSDPVKSPWTVYQGKIYRAKVDVIGPIEAVFCDGRMMIEARWPNCAWEENWQPDKKWALTDPGSDMGHIVSAALAKSGQDLSGGLLYIKLSKGNNCFTRPVTHHRAGEAALEYDKTGIKGRAWGEDSMPERIKSYGLAGNRFFVTARGALDTPGEWWHDTDRGELLFISPDGGDPARHEVSIKARIAGFEGAGCSDIVLDGLEFRGCNVQFEGSRRITLRGCRFLYPSTPMVFPDAKTALTTEKNILVEGQDNVVERCLIEWAVDGALEVEGTGNRVENCVVHDCNLHGRHAGPGINVRGSGVAQRTNSPAPNMVRRCTVYNVGGVGVNAMGEGSAVVEFNHVFNAGLYCVDVAAIYIPVGAKTQGSVVHHNWLHDVHGLGFRVDIQGRNITFHHNLVWNALVGCKMQGFQLEGYNNTLLVNKPKAGFIVVFEPEATAAERAGWRIRNNAAYVFIDRLPLRSDYKHAGRKFQLPLKPETGTIDHNVTISENDESRLFLDFAHDDFRPRPGGPLDAAGLPIPAIAEGLAGRPPSIGALETDEPPWIAGADWVNENLSVPLTPQVASDLARHLRPATCSVNHLDTQYDKQ